MSHSRTVQPNSPAEVVQSACKFNGPNSNRQPDNKATINEKTSKIFPSRNKNWTAKFYTNSSQEKNRSILQSNRRGQCRGLILFFFKLHKWEEDYTIFVFWAPCHMCWCVYRRRRISRFYPTSFITDGRIGEVRHLYIYCRQYNGKVGILFEPYEACNENLLKRTFTERTRQTKIWCFLLATMTVAYTVYSSALFIRAHSS